MEQRIHKKEEFELSREGLLELGKHQANESEMYNMIKTWQSKRKNTIIKELISLSTNPDITERIVGILIGKIKAMEDDLNSLFTLAGKEYNKKLKTEE